MKLSPPQREVLGLLREYGARNRPGYTAPTTYTAMDCCYVAGSVAAALVKRGLARYTSGYQVGIAGSTKVAITAEGLRALEAAS